MTKMMSVFVSEQTHASLFLLQAKLMTFDKKKHSMDEIIHKLLVTWDNVHINPLNEFKLENIET